MTNSELVVALIKAFPWWQFLIAFVVWKFGATFIDALRRGSIDVQAAIPGILEVGVKQKALEREVQNLESQTTRSGRFEGMSTAGLENVVEATKFVLRSPNGAARVEIGVAGSEPWLPFIRFFDEHGKTRAVLGISKDQAGLYLLKPNGAIASLDTESVTITDKPGFGTSVFLGLLPSDATSTLVLAGSANEKPVILRPSPKT